jgi:hypothetical protein
MEGQSLQRSFPRQGDLKQEKEFSEFVLFQEIVAMQPYSSIKNCVRVQLIQEEKRRLLLTSPMTVVSTLGERRGLYY